MKFNDAGLQIIKTFEGCRLQAYQDIRGIWTIGFGCVDPSIYPGLVISQAQADEMLMERLEDEFIPGVTGLVKVSLNDNQFSALVSLAYNIGLANLKSSGLLKLVNLGDFKDAADRFLSWDKAGGQQIDGLLRRREAERTLFLSSPSS